MFPTEPENVFTLNINQIIFGNEKLVFVSNFNKNSR